MVFSIRCIMLIANKYLNSVTVPIQLFSAQEATNNPYSFGIISTPFSIRSDKALAI